MMHTIPKPPIVVIDSVPLKRCGKSNPKGASY
jgi:hypothetical protein